MPTPIYIICSQSGAEDKATGLVSYFNVVERIQIGKIPPVGAGSPLVELRISAVWSRQPDDEGQEFDFVLALKMPPEEQETVVGNGTFRFAHQNQRITGRIVGFLPYSTPGTLRAFARIKRTGTEKWMTQEYPIIIEEPQPIVPAGS